MLVATGATTTPPRSSAPPPLSAQAVAFGPDAVPFYGSASSYRNGLPRGWSESSDTVGAFADMYKWARVVYMGNACELPGVKIKFDTFIPYMWKAVRMGYVQAQHAEFVQLGLRWGFEVGLHPDRVHGHRFFKNYESSTCSAARARVTEATEARVSAGKTLHLGAVGPDTLSLMRQVFDAAYIFPMGRALPAIVCIQAVARGWLMRRAQTRARVSPLEDFGAFLGRWAPGKKCIYGRLEWAYFFPAEEGERLFARVLALNLGLSYFMACVVTGMLLALGTAARLLLDDDAQLRFTAAECVEVKREHMARSIQAWWRYLTARRARDGPPLPEGAVGWCACSYCPLPVYPGEGSYCDLCWPVGCGCVCVCQCQCEPVDRTAPAGDRPRVRRGHHGRHGVRRLLVLTAMMGLAGAAPRDGYSSQVASVQYPRASLYDGLPVDLLEAADELMSNRLAPSSMATVNIAFERYWTPLADEHGWPVILETDDPERGGKLAAFVLRLLDDTNLVADSIQSYVWGLRWKMKLEHQADPALGVMHWQEFMRSVRVKSHVPHERRRRRAWRDRRRRG